jgi:hypothetical protein
MCHAALAENDHAVGHRQRRVHVLLDQQYADPLGLHAHDRAQHVLHHLRCQPLARLVHQHQTGAADQRTRNGNHLHLAAERFSDSRSSR